MYKRGVGIRETVWVGVWFGKSKSVAGVGLFLPAEPRRVEKPPRKKATTKLVRKTKTAMADASWQNKVPSSCSKKLAELYSVLLLVAKRSPALPGRSEETSGGDLGGDVHRPPDAKS